MKKVELADCKCGAPAFIEKNGSYWRVCCSKIPVGSVGGFSVIFHDSVHQMKTKKDAVNLWNEFRANRNN